MAKKYHFVVEVLQENQIKSILEFIVENYLRTSRIKSINIGILYTYITSSKKMDITDSYRRALNALEERYIKYKRENGLYDFTDYPLYLYNMLEAYKEDITTIDALFVDEFQDVDTVQFQVFEKVLAKKKFFIGDSWQCIYEFRGADGEVFNKLGEDFDIYKLKHNYRSYQEIINYATTVYQALSASSPQGDCYISQQDWCDYSSIQCERGEGGVVMVINPYKEGFQVIQGDHIKPLRQPIQEAYNFLKQNNPMILCRTNKQVKSIQGFGWVNTTTIHQAKGLEYDNVVVVDMAIRDNEDLNVVYVAMTRARDGLLVVPWPILETLLRRYNINPYGI